MYYRIIYQKTNNFRPYLLQALVTKINKDVRSFLETIQLTEFNYIITMGVFSNNDFYQSSLIIGFTCIFLMNIQYVLLSVSIYSNEICNY